MSDRTRDLGDRLASIRKRRSLTQTELAEAAGVSVSTVCKLEQHEYGTPRLATLRKLAAALGVPTSVLQGDSHSDAESADTATLDLWEPVRHALAAPPESDEADQPTATEVRAELRRLQGLMAAHRYSEMAAAAPALLRDSATIDDRGLRSAALGMVGWLLVQNRQWDDAAVVLDQAVDAADDEILAAGAVTTRVWSEIRQGNLSEARTLAMSTADRIEPRFSRATVSALAIWGRLWLYVATIAARDNRPHEHDDALGLARAAAARIGTEVCTELATTRIFGPTSVEHLAAETAAITEQPALALTIAERTPPATLLPTAAGRLRHRLDMANAHTQLGQWSEATGALMTVAQMAPQWLAQQRYARDIVGEMVERRRTLTDEMRQLADTVRLEL
ncbi:helix-turn-helix transcriptional regulator [Nocardia farcinica]|uniref:helix-turn-helix domain-containing protein n=1 Tax=Nocardia farcinica TaxID=37329 RepID=UPI001895C913|nr:helix-turn-helix transcriptional regulator [Nocardia farcinica]MBF6363233.1 helix-turn-helix transcriptional regulator [Nocardia farcinica]